MGSTSDWSKQNFPWVTTIQKHYPDLGSNMSSGQNFRADFPDVISQGNKRWHGKTSADISG